PIPNQSRFTRLPIPTNRHPSDGDHVSAGCCKAPSSVAASSAPPGTTGRTPGTSLSSWSPTTRPGAYYETVRGGYTIEQKRGVDRSRWFTLAPRRAPHSRNVWQTCLTPSGYNAYRTSPVNCGAAWTLQPSP